MASFISPTGYVELDNDCQYSIDLKSTRSRETIIPKDDLAFYWKEYLVPKYSLNNINVSNCASFMKDLDMNWSKLDKPLKQKVLDILIDAILVNDTGLKNDLLNKLSGSVSNSPISTPELDTPGISPFSNISKSSFGNGENDKSDFGNKPLSITSWVIFTGLIICILVSAYFIEKHYKFLQK